MPGTMVTTNVRLVRHLGQGGMGSVWVGEHIALETQVAVKFISALVQQMGAPGVLDRFKREAKAAAKIKSPHVVHIYDHGVTGDGAPFIVMELLEGESLGQRLERCKTVSLTEAAAIMAQVAKGLGVAHKLGIVHRDIKPDNIFLTRAGDELLVKVLDFGIAKLASSSGKTRGLTGSRMLLGTPDYMSPEQLLRPKETDYRADLWSLAVAVYEAITGRVPFVGETDTALAIAVTTGEFTPPSQFGIGLPQELDGWFEQSLRLDPKQRFVSAKAMAAAFIQACASVIDPSALLADSGALPRAQLGLDMLAQSGEHRAANEGAWNRNEWMTRTGDGAEIGPLSLEQLYEDLKEGQLPPDAKIARVGSTDWQLASLVLLKHAKPSKPPPPAPRVSEVAIPRPAPTPAGDTIPEPPAEISPTPSAPKRPPTKQQPPSFPGQTAPGGTPPEQWLEPQEQLSDPEAAPVSSTDEPLLSAPQPASEVPEVPDAVEALDLVGAPDVPTIPKVPEASDAVEAPDEPTIPKVPDASELSGNEPEFKVPEASEIAETTADNEAVVVDDSTVKQPAAQISSSLEAVEAPSSFQQPLSEAEPLLETFEEGPHPAHPGTFAGASSTLNREMPSKKRTGLIIAVAISAVVVIGGSIALLSLTGSKDSTRTSARSKKPQPLTTKQKPKEPLKPAPDGMVAVAGGAYSIGCDPKMAKKCWDDEKPVHPVKLGRFAFMKYEVTTEQYAKCVAAKACPIPGTKKGCTWKKRSRKKRHPINCVTWQAASAYCKHRGWRLPSETEWEVAARGSKLVLFPWGKQSPTCKLAVLTEGGRKGCGSGEALAVGKRPKDKSWIGAFDMAGNVREWTATDYAAYRGGKADSTRRGKINRGGSYLLTTKKFYGLHTRGANPINTSQTSLGFRCAVDL